MGQPPAHGVRIAWQDPLLSFLKDKEPIRLSDSEDNAIGCLLPGEKCFYMLGVVHVVVGGLKGLKGKLVRGRVFYADAVKKGFEEEIILAVNVSGEHSPSFSEEQADTYYQLSRLPEKLDQLIAAIKARA